MWWHRGWERVDGGRCGQGFKRPEEKSGLSPRHWVRVKAFDKIKAEL